MVVVDGDGAAAAAAAEFQKTHCCTHGQSCWGGKMKDHLEMKMVVGDAVVVVVGQTEVVHS